LKLILVCFYQVASFYFCYFYFYCFFYFLIFFIIKRKKGKFLGEILKMRYDNVDDFFIYSMGMVEDLSVVAFTIFYVNCRTSKAC